MRITDAAPIAAALKPRRNRGVRSIGFVRLGNQYSRLRKSDCLVYCAGTDIKGYVIRAFVKMREELVANAAILKRLAEIDKTLVIHDVALRETWQKLRPLVAPRPPPPKPEIGFHAKEETAPYRTRKKALRP